MLTQGKIDQFYKDVESLQLKRKVAEIQRATNFPKSNISEWLNKKKVPSEKFINAFYDSFKLQLQKSSTNDSIVKEPDYIYNTSEKKLFLIELKTASGKPIQVIPKGQTEITLLNAFLEERDRVIDTKQERIDELLNDKEKLYTLLNSSLGDITKVQQAIFAMVRTLQQHEAVMTMPGNKKREAEMLDTLSKLNGDNLKVDAKQDSAVVLHK